MATAKHELTAERLRELLDYDIASGRIVWKQQIGRGRAGEEAGSRDHYGYVVIKLFGHRIKAHRLAWLMAFGSWPEGEIDHINGIKSDNRIENLRVVTRKGNTQNIRGPISTNTHGHLGVSQRPNGRWFAQLHIDGRNHCIGTFDTAEEAHQAYLLAKRENHPTASI